MIGSGTIINSVGIVMGGFSGLLFGKLLKKRYQESLNLACGVSVLFIGIAGAIQDGISGDWSILATKAILDFVIIMVMTCSLGKGCMFSAIPVFLFEGAITLLAVLIKPLMTDDALKSLSLIGSILIFCVGLNLIWGKKVRVANLLPAILLAVGAGYMRP